MQHQTDAPESIKISVFLGASGDDTSNVKLLLESWTDYLERFTVETFGDTDPPDGIRNEIEHVSIPTPVRPTPFGRVWAVYRQTKQYIERHDPDVVMQCWKFSTHAAGVALAGQRTGTPVIARLSSDAFNEYKDQSYGFLATAGVLALNNILGRVPVRLADEVIALGPYGKRQLSQRGAADDNVTILPPPRPSTDRFSPPEEVAEVRQSLDLDPDDRIALYVGRLTLQKGMNFLSDVIEELSEWTFVLVGEGPQSESLGEYDSVIEPGYVPHESIHKYYQAADVYIHPSPLEGVPLVVLEALSCSTPVVARQAGDLDFVTGNTVSDPVEMAALLQSGEYDTTWRNVEQFEEEFQRETLSGIVRSAVDD